MSRVVQQVSSVTAEVVAAAARRRAVALRAMLCVTVPLLVGLLLGQPAEGAQASFGGLAGLYVTDAPFRYRARVVATVGAGLTLAVFLGGLAGGSVWAIAALVVGLVAGLSSFLCQAAELPPPRELMLVMTVLAATAIPADPASALARAALTAAGALFAVLVSVSPVLGGRRQPETRLIAMALSAIANLMTATGTIDEPGARHAAVVAVRRAAMGLEQGGAPATDRLPRLMVATEMLLEATLHAGVESGAPLNPYWAQSVRDLIPAIRIGDLPPTLMIAGGGPRGAALTEAIAMVSRAIKGETSKARVNDIEPQLPPWPGLLSQVRAAARRGSVIIPTAARIGIAVALGVGIGSALGVAHAFWVGLTACAVLQASNLSVTRSRFFYRLIGTAIGVGLVFALLSWDPPLIVVIAAIGVFQILVELVITVNYGLAVIGITVLALLLFHISAPGEDVGSVIGARLIDTGVGALLALVLRSVLWPHATAARLPQVQARVLRSVCRVLGALWSPGQAGLLADERRQLRGDIAALRAVQADALADSRSASPATDLRWPVTVAVEDLAYLALAVPSHRPPPLAEHTTAFLTGLESLSQMVADDSVDVPGFTADLPGFPRTSAAAATLNRLIATSR